MWRLGTSLRLGILFSILYIYVLVGYSADKAISSRLNGLTANYLAALPSLGRLAPYLERDCLRSLTPAVSKLPRTIW